MPKQDYTEKEIKHLEMIESVIERMGQNKGDYDIAVQL